MASRQRPAVEDVQRVLEDDVAVSGPGEGDEIMEEVEEQEDDYSEYFLLPCIPLRGSVAQRYDVDLLSRF
jgi:hypothetical protein